MKPITSLITEHLDIWTAADTEKKSGRGRASGNANSVYGVKKLRELILELAVRGKLVPQDPNDEPASELLKRILAEKAKLVVEGKIKKEKQNAMIDADETGFDLPRGWMWTRLFSIGTTGTGRTPNTQNSIFYDGQVPFIGPGQITSNCDLLPAEKWLSEAGKCETTIAKAGDILMVCIGGSIGKSAIADQEMGFNQQINYVSPMLIKSRFVHILLRSDTFQSKVFQSASGSATPIINKSKWEELPIPIAPLAEQHRIVAKVDELMALCDQLEAQHNNASDAHEQLVSHLLSTLTQSQDAADFNTNWQRIATHFDTLFTTEASIDTLKQTLLQLAVMGKLVPQDQNDEPASELLKRIQVEKAKLVAQGKIKKDKPLADITTTEKLFELPQNWIWVRLQNAIDVRDGTHDSPKEALGDGTFPLVTSKDFDDGKINFESARRISAPDHFEIAKRSYVEKYDILFSMIGGNIGNQAMVLDDRPFSIKNVALFKYYDQNLTDPYFIKKFLEHVALTLQSEAVGGAQPFVSLGVLRNLVLALPPKKEQIRIVIKINELLFQCDQIKISISRANQIRKKIADLFVHKTVI